MKAVTVTLGLYDRLVLRKAHRLCKQLLTIEAFLRTGTTKISAKDKKYFDDIIEDCHKIQKAIEAMK